MNRAFKIRYLFCGRFDSQHLLKLLIGFNVFLGIYLLFLSANYRHYSDYSSAAHSRAESSKVALPPPAHLSQPLANYGDTNELNAPNAAAAKQALLVKEKNVIAGDGGGTNLVKIESDNAQQLAAAAAAKQAKQPPQSSAADQLNVVDKIYDSNNKLVVQEEPPDNSANPDASYKRVEEDDKTSLDENDKLRIEMMGDKSGNSIIHDSEFSGEKQAQPPPPKNVIAAKPLAEEASGRAKGAAGKMPSDQQQQEEGAIISRILDHNQHIVNGTGGGGKLTVPDAPLNSEGSAGSPAEPMMTAEVRGKYAILRDYIPLTVTPTSQALARSITLTTQGTPDFLHHILPLVDRWEGLISVSVYAPGADFRLAVNAIHYLRQCGPAGVGERVHWHLVYDTLYPPPPPPPTVETFSSNSNTSAVAPASAYLARSQHFDCNLPLDETMKLLSVASDFRASHSLPYPINVLRNVARQAAKTHFLFASDIELYPSVGIVPAFFDLLDRERRGLVPEATSNSSNPHVYVLPIFEVKANKSPPRTKKELLKLFAARDAIFFHRYVCDLCQNFPDRALWVQSVPPNDSLNVFRVTRRLRERSQWEPLYIGTNDEPFYDERLTWDGKRDKMTQMFEMCLKNYDLFILDSAFLVHAPGIKYYSVKDDAKRLPFIKANQKVHNLLLSQLRRKYGTKSKC